MTFASTLHVVSTVAVAVTLALLCVLVRRLRISEARFRLLAETSEDMVCLHSADGTYLYVSPSVERLLGRTPRELLGRCPSVLVHPEDVAGVRLAMLGRSPARITYRVSAKDGRYVWFETLVRPIVDPQTGTPVRVQTSSRDVTDRKHAEDTYRTLAANLPDMSVILYDSNLRIVAAEGVLTTHHGFSKERMEGRTFRQLFSMSLGREELAEAEERWRAALQGRTTTLDVPFGGRVYAVHHVPVVHDTRVVAGMIVSRDMTDERAASTALQDSMADLERSNRDLEQFADIASHELKTPLRHISSFAELLAEEHEGLLSADADEYIARIVAGVHEMQGVIEALLRYSRAKTTESRMQQVDMRRLVTHVLDALGPWIRDVGGQVLVASVLPTLRGDPVLLRQLLENLIWNGLKFSCPNPIVTIRARRDLLEWVFEVVDNGPGVDADHREMIFHMFKRSRTDVEGSGVGLALCKKIVGIHRGRIWVEDGNGPEGRRGASFRFAIPARTSTQVPE